MNNIPRDEILVAENDQEYLEHTLRFLRHFNFKCQGVHTIKEARKKILSKKFKLLIADLHLANDYDHDDWSGLTLIEFIKNNNINMNVIIYSGSENYYAVREAFVKSGTGVQVDYVGKAEDPEYFLQTVRHMFGEQ
jgi:DNA-binding NtrC family response regulator